MAFKITGGKLIDLETGAAVVPELGNPMHLKAIRAEEEAQERDARTAGQEARQPVHKPQLPDSKKQRLFIRDGHLVGYWGKRVELEIGNQAQLVALQWRTPWKRPEAKVTIQRTDRRTYKAFRRWKVVASFKCLKCNKKVSAQREGSTPWPW